MFLSFVDFARSGRNRVGPCLPGRTAYHHKGRRWQILIGMRGTTASSGVKVEKGRAVASGLVARPAPMPAQIAQAKKGNVRGRSPVDGCAMIRPEQVISRPRHCMWSIPPRPTRSEPDATRSPPRPSKGRCSRLRLSATLEFHRAFGKQAFSCGGGSEDEP